MEKKEIQKVTFNVPKADYEQYKKNLRSVGKIPTYDFIAYIRSVNKSFEQQNQE